MTKRKPLHELPKAKGRPRGKRCATCTKLRPYSAFNPTKSLVCVHCKSGGQHARGPYDCNCVFCGDDFVARSPIATCCGKEECRASRTNLYRRLRKLKNERARRLSQRKNRKRH